MSPKAGSRKASVFEAFNKDGAGGAIALGTTLGLKLGTVRSWVGTWSKGGPETIKVRGRKMVTKKTVIVTWAPTRTAYLIDEGAQVSEVRWEDDGSHQFITNTQLSKPEE